MNFINNWAGRLTGELAAAGTALPIAEELLARLDLTGGAEYVLTLTDKLDYLSDPAPVYEVVHITAAGLERGQEGTIARDWPADTIVFAGVTAGVLVELAQGGGGGGVGAWQPLALIDGQDWQGWAFARLEGDVARVWFSVTALREGGFGVPDSPAFELPPALRPVNNPFGSARFTVVCQGSDGGPRAGVMEIDSSGYPGFYLPEGMVWAAGTRLTADVTFSQTAFPFP